MDHIDKEYWSSFIGKNATKYMSKFLEFKVSEETKFKPTWHWPAFFVPELWMFYRKMYLLSAIYVVASFWVGPTLNLVGMVISGLAGNYWYYRHARSKIRRSASDHKNKPNLVEVPLKTYLVEEGGTNSFWAMLAFIAIITLLTGFVNSGVSESYQTAIYTI